MQGAKEWDRTNRYASVFWAENAEAAGLQIVALCDTWEARLIEAGKRLGVATYTDFDTFLDHDMDGVIVANYARQVWDETGA